MLRKKLEEAKTLAAEIVETAKGDIESVKQKVTESVETEIANLDKGFDEKKSKLKHQKLRDKLFLKYLMSY